MRVVIFGTGGAGGFFGGQLARAGESVAFIARGAHLDAIRRDGLRLESPAGETIVRPALATDDPALAGPADVVIVGVKAWQVPAAAEAIRPLMGPETIVVPLQNGVESTSQLAAVLGPANVLVGLCGTLSFVSAPGRIRTLGAANYIRFGEPDNRRSDRTERLRRAFDAAGVTVEVPADIQKAVWDKFLLITSFGGVGAVTRAPVGVIRALPETRRLLQQCMEEVEALARARGVALAATIVSDTFRHIDAMAPGGTTSLQRDFADGKPTELEYWNGAVVRLAREMNVATPLHDFIYRCLLPQERHARGETSFP